MDVQYDGDKVFMSGMMMDCPPTQVSQQPPLYLPTTYLRLTHRLPLLTFAHLLIKHYSLLPFGVPVLVILNISYRLDFINFT